MDDPRPEGEDKERLLRMIDSLLYSNSEEGVDLCFSFDTTGSMYACLQKVRENIATTCTKLLTDIPNMRISIIAHGDYCDDGYAYVIKVLDFSSDVNAIVKFVKGVEGSGGGDLPEAYELVLRDAQKLKWRARSAKALVMIGDSPPHAASYTDQHIWWRHELDQLYRLLGCKVYAVQAGNFQEATAFYQELARRSGGVYLPLQSFNLITQMFMAVCYREKSVEMLRKFRLEVQNTREASAMATIFNKLEHETAPPALGQQHSDWWDTSRDPKRQQYRFDKTTKRYVSDVKTVKVDPIVAAREATMRDEMARTATPSFSTRTGGAILDASRSKPRPKEVIEKVAAEDDPYTVRNVRGCIFEVVLKSSLPPEEREAMAKAQPPPPRPPSKTGKALALIVSPAERKAMAVKRLMRDMAEVHRNPVHNVAACPLESNILMWHVSLAGPAGSAYSDVIFHLTMEFPTNYPKKPPRVMICTTLVHPSVYGKWVCLDMLELGGWAAEGEEERIFTGWSSGYSVLSILLQLQAFLFEGAMSEPHFVEEARKRAKAFVCKECGHGKDGKVHPPLPNIPPPPVGSLPKLSPPKTPSKAAAAKSPLIAAPKAATPLAKLSTTSLPSSPTPAAPKQVVRSHVSTLQGLTAGVAINGVVVRMKEGVGAWIKIGIAPLAFLPIPHASASFVKSIEAVLKPGQAVVCYVLSVDAKAGRLSVSLISNPLMRAFKEQPRMELAELILGSPRLGVVERVDRGGALVDCGVRNRVWGRLALANATDDATATALDIFEVGEVITVVPSAVDLESSTLTLRARLTATHRKVAPSIPVVMLNLPAKTTKAGALVDPEMALAASGWSHLSVEIIYNILQRLTPQDVARLGRTCHFFHKLAADGTSYLFERNELVCFHSKLHFSEDVLGVGINLENKLNGKLAYITTTFDLVSLQAFTVEKIRKASYKEPFTHWLPLYINPTHGAKALPLVKEAMAKICTEAYGSFEPWMIIEVIPKLMNSMVVQVMSGKLFGSVMALEGYSAFHHLFLVLLEEYPELKAQVDATIRDFINGTESARHKKQIPALGEWLPLLSVTETFSWADVCTAYLGEMFDRNVLWTLKAHPDLSRWNAADDATLRAARLRKTYEATTVSNHLLMFHVYFLDNVARPPGMSLKHLKELLDVRFGKPTWAMKEALMREVKRIRSFADWGSFFHYIHVRPPTEQALLDWLQRAQANSERRRYHRPGDFGGDREGR